MSEFKEGQLVIRLDNDNAAIYTIQKIEDDCISIGVVRNGKLWGWAIHPKYLRKAEVEEITIGHRLKKYDPETLGDDSHIENHISPLCKSKDV
ncbi:hypothetical protein [Acinetobacter phage vB_AbaM_BP10]|nr:hypothetical protein [Acinetobacter phage vB_AbaM_BP10]